CLGDDGYYW
nr:immunoglobulin heavy chain junction region [Mus musculus]MBK4187714.1 immunoglobulin heavy chain junction region [Mus musculus]